MAIMEEEAAGIISEKGIRVDGRGTEQIRGQMFMKPGVLSQAKGSAYAEVGRTKVLAAVYGPKPSDARTAFSDQGSIQANVKFASFATAERGHVSRSSATATQFSEAVSDAFSCVVLLKRYPKAVIEVHVTVMEAGGSELAVVMMAASLALCDAGIEMTGIVSAASVITVAQHMLLDPAAEEEAQQDRSVTVAMLAHPQQVVHLDVSGVFSAAELKASIELVASACTYFDTHLRTASLERLQEVAPPAAA